MKKYGFMFEDPECGFDVPLIIYIYADNFKEACKKGKTCVYWLTGQKMKVNGFIKRSSSTAKEGGYNDY